MDCDLVAVPRQTSVKETARLMQRAGAADAAVVDEQGCYVRTLTMADLLRWIAEGCPEAIVGPALTCRYQVRGRLLNGDEAEICLLAKDVCRFQHTQPTTGGRRSTICMRQEDDASPYGAFCCYAAADVATVGRQTLLRELLRRITGSAGNRIVVLDELGRPVGAVSAGSVLNALTDRTYDPGKRAQ